MVASAAEFGFEKTQIQARNNFNCQPIEVILVEIGAGNMSSASGKLRLTAWERS